MTTDILASHIAATAQPTENREVEAKDFTIVTYGSGVPVSWMKRVAKALGLDWDEVSEALHDYKEDNGHGGADNIDRKTFAQILHDVFSIPWKLLNRFLNPKDREKDDDSQER